MKVLVGPKISYYVHLLTEFYFFKKQLINYVFFQLIVALAVAAVVAEPEAKADAQVYGHPGYYGYGGYGLGNRGFYGGHYGYGLGLVRPGIAAHPGLATSYSDR